MEPILLGEDLREPRKREMYVLDENESVKYNDEAPHGLLTVNQYDVDPQPKPACSSTKPRLISQADLSNLLHHLSL